uniref:SFRICE_036723 n=1 Tax=Spodoptera frugiperda TaxID=7108 RepID=A0A2H1WM37_SPOFR
MVDYGILVGAPEDQLYSAYEYNVTRPGAVYRCEPGYRNYAAEGNVRTLDRCTPMIFDKNPKFNVSFRNHEQMTVPCPRDVCRGAHARDSYRARAPDLYDIRQLLRNVTLHAGIALCSLDGRNVSCRDE